MWSTVREYGRGWVQSAAGVTVLLSLAVAAAAAWDKGPYIIVNTVVTGGMLGLMAMGLALVFGVMNIGQFAHGEYFMIGTLAAYYIMTPLQEHLAAHPGSALTLVAPFAAILGSLLAGAAAGVLTERLVFSPLRKRSKANWVMNTFLLTLGVSIILVNGHQLLFGTNYKGIAQYWNAPALSVFDVFVAVDRVVALGLSLVLITAFWLFMKRTQLGRAIRAVSQDETGALVVGISLDGIQVLTMALSCALASVAGGSLLFMYPAYPTVGLEPLYLAWFVVILVGLGNVMGALVGGFIVALIKVVTVQYLGAGWDFIVPSFLIIVVLLFKPSGIFGSEVRGVLDR